VRSSPTASSACWRSCALASKPRMLLLDEPTSGMSPQRLPDHPAHTGSCPFADAARRRARHGGRLRDSRQDYGPPPASLPGAPAGRGTRDEQVRRSISAEAPDAMLELKDVSTLRHEPRPGASLSRFPRAGCTALLGRNGASKTTTIHSVAGLTRRVRQHLRGRRSRGYRHISSSGSASSPGMTHLPSLTIRENLTMPARGANGSGRNRRERNPGP